MHKEENQFENQVLMVALVKALECGTKVALDGGHQWMAVLTFQGVQPYVAVKILEVVDQVVVMALEVVEPAVDPDPHKDPVSAASTDASVPSVDIAVAEALAVDVQDLDLWIALLTSWAFSVVVLSAFPLVAASQ